MAKPKQKIPAENVQLAISSNKTHIELIIETVNSKLRSTPFISPHELAIATRASSFFYSKKFTVKKTFEPWA